MTGGAALRSRESFFPVRSIPAQGNLMGISLIVPPLRAIEFCCSRTQLFKWVPHRRHGCVVFAYYLLPSCTVEVWTLAIVALATSYRASVPCHVTFCRILGYIIARR